MSQTRSSGSENSEHLHDPDFLSNSASSFNTRDVRSLRVSFCSATQANEVIPNRNVNIPQEYILPGVNRTVLAMEELDIDQLCQNDHDYVKTFIYKLHEVVKNTKLVIGTSEASTDTLFLKDCITFKLRLHPLFKFYVGNVILSAKAEFVINYRNYSLLVVEVLQNMSQTRSSGSENSEHLHDPDFLSNSASSFNTRDVRSLRVSFCSATQANEVIPNRNVNIPQEYILPGVNRTVLAMEELDIDQLCQNDHDYVKTFIYKLHEVVKNTKLVIGTSEASTDTLFLKDCITFKLRLHPLFKFYVGNVILSAKAEFVINYRNYSLLVVEDKHLNNIRPTNDYGEPQIGAEILACGDENIRQAREAFNMTIFAVRVVSTYVTFYRATISKSYWNELAIGCPRQQSITVLRWPGNSSDPIVGFDLAEPNGRRGVLEALSRIRHYFLY
ncbi:635_t:CDS:2 [Entrophospora sp. SA101]|nr:635_t:CDS:2 [Entrophospora sp. SA101]